jgi:hypothetical protein
LAVAVEVVQAAVVLVVITTRLPNSYLLEPLQLQLVEVVQEQLQRTYG